MSEFGPPSPPPPDDNPDEQDQPDPTAAEPPADDSTPAEAEGFDQFAHREQEKSTLPSGEPVAL